MYYKELAEEFFNLMVKSHKRPIVPPDPKDFSKGEIGILIFLTFQKDGVTSGHLSEELLVSTGRIASALKTLEKKQLIERRMDGKDKRRVNVYITEAGRKFTLEKHEHAINGMCTCLQKLDKEEAKLFVDLAKKLFS